MYFCKTPKCVDTSDTMCTLCVLEYSPFAVQLDEGTLEEPEIAYILQQVLRALAYVHAQQRVHRDVKAANVLLSVAGAVKISDFGVSGQMTGAFLLPSV